MKESKVSKSLLEVWEWKELAYKEIKSLPTEEAIKKRVSDSLKTAEKMGFKLLGRHGERIRNLPVDISS